jgi:hypothetical protein
MGASSFEFSVFGIVFSFDCITPAEVPLSFVASSCSAGEFEIHQEKKSASKKCEKKESRRYGHLSLDIHSQNHNTTRLRFTI